MRSIKLYILFLITLGLFSAACSELQNDIVVPTKIGIHGQEVFTKTSASFHGKTLIGNSLDGCRQCHASDLSGGTAKVSCASADCHPTINVHVAENKTTVKYHGKYIANLNWNMRDCANCHGNNYAGGVSSPACTTCHKNTGGPEACNTCHGDFSNPNSIAPPKALDDATVTTDPGVGAHSVHLTGLKDMQIITCNECHIVPNSIYSVGHFDNSPKAEIVFGNLTNAGVTQGSYNPSSNTCANTYCHGNFQFTRANSEYKWAYTSDKISGNNYSPQWTKVDGTEGKCGTCHGLPPAGHMSAELKSCSTCHPGIVKEVVVNKVLTLEIADKTKHINGKVNVFGN